MGARSIDSCFYGSPSKDGFHIFVLTHEKGVKSADDHFQVDAQ